MVPTYVIATSVALATRAPTHAPNTVDHLRQTLPAHPTASTRVADSVAPMRRGQWHADRTRGSGHVTAHTRRARDGPATDHPAAASTGERGTGRRLDTRPQSALGTPTPLRRVCLLHAYQPRITSARTSSATERTGPYAGVDNPGQGRGPSVAETAGSPRAMNGGRPRSGVNRSVATTSRWTRRDPPPPTHR